MEYLKNSETDISSSFVIFLPLLGVLTRVNDGGSLGDLRFVVDAAAVTDAGAVTDAVVTDPVEAASVVDTAEGIGHEEIRVVLK